MLRSVICSGSTWTLNGRPIFDGSLLGFRVDGEWSRWRAVMPIPQGAGLRPKLWLLRDELASPADPEATVEQMTGELVIEQALEARWEQ
jgi:hypothetical protein